MSGRFVRASKYRHVFGRPTKKEQCYDNLRITKNAWDTNLIKVNPEYLSVNWEAGGGGALAVIPLSEKGKLPDRIPLFRGHTAAVLDTDWNPFNDSLLASGSDDGKVFLWKVPDDFTVRLEEKQEPQDVAPVAKLAGHGRKVGHVLFNPSSANILASSSGDYTVKIWDLADGTPKLTLKHADMVQSLSWNASGSMLVTTSRDKKLRVWDVRQERPAIETPGHAGAKNSRAVWMGELDKIATTGFSKMSDRQLGLWDVREPRAPVNGFEILDQISGVCMPFWDDGTKMLYLAGKGDGNIRYYEYDNNTFQYLSQHTSTDPQRGVSFVPKRGVSVQENEVARAYKTVNDSYIEPISFIVPRRAEVFQEDVFPPTTGLKPAMSSSEWLSGKDDLPPKISLESVYEGAQEPEEVPSDYKPTSIPPAANAAVSAAPKQAPSPSPSTPSTPAAPVNPRAGGSIKDQQSSIASMANKFADKDDDKPQGKADSDDDASSFEEVSRPSEQRAAALPSRTSTAPKDEPAPFKPPTTATATTTASPAAAAASAPVAAATPTTTATPSHPRTASTSSAPSGAAEGLKSHLNDIKTLLETQAQMITRQGEQLNHLTREVERLKLAGSSDAGANNNNNNNGSSGDAQALRERDERIRVLEMELEEARAEAGGIIAS